MPTGVFYLPESHSFEHFATAPWPHIHRNWQSDWVDSVDHLESWLNRYVGPHWASWAYAQQQNQEYWQACIAFKWAKHKTLFLLTWS
jgi:hypothetical protein